jgi:hypothetical protein
MENMFKKSLLALAMVGASTSALAIDVATNSGTAKTVSVEGLALQTSAVKAEANAIVLTSAAEYSLGDIITIDITGGEFDVTNAPYSLTQTTTPTGNSAVTFGPILTSKTQLKFRVTAVTAAGTSPTNSTVGNRFTLGDTDQDGTGTASTTAVDVAIASITKDAKVSITAKTTIGATDTVIDATSKDSATLFTGVEEYTVTPVQKDAKVDVKEMRKKFVTAPVPTLQVGYAAANVAAVDFANYNLLLTGDLTGVSSVQFGATATDVLKIATDKQSATVDFAKAKVVTGGAVELKFNLPTAAADQVALVAPQSLKLALTGKATAGNYKLLDKTVSEWTLNGDSEFVEIMPFGEKYSRYIAVTNNGTVEGEITVELYSDGKMVAAKKVGTASKYSVTNVTAAVDALAKENSVTGVAGVRVTTNSPDTNIEVTALYFDSENKDHVKVN